MAFSIAKSFIGLIAGLGWDRGLLASLDQPVCQSLGDALFATAHNQAITWDQLLRQTSEWEGTLWGIPTWAVNADRIRRRAIAESEINPGTKFEYNDVRVNLLALCLLQLWREPLPAVLGREVMSRIGASRSWEWHGYRNSWVTLDGRPMQSVSGGGHWGGGLWISSRDLARWGLMLLRHGAWGPTQIVSRDWVRMMQAPGPANAQHGHINWELNLGRKLLPSAPEQALYTTGSVMGDGGLRAVNAVYLDPVHDLVVVLRWLRGEALDAVIGAILASLRPA